MTTVSPADNDTIHEPLMWLLISQPDDVIISLYPSLSGATLYDRAERVVTQIEVDDATSGDDGETFARESRAALVALQLNADAWVTDNVLGYEIDGLPGLTFVDYRQENER